MRISSLYAVAVALCFAIACKSQTAVPIQNTKVATFVLTGEQAIKLVHHCTDNYTEGVQGYWAPSAEDIASLEVSLPAFLNSYSNLNLDLNSYLRQCTGTLKNNRRLIFVSGFHASLRDNHPDSQRITNEALVICGGGNLVYGVEYDIESKTFMNFMFNASK